MYELLTINVGNGSYEIRVSSKPDCIDQGEYDSAETVLELVKFYAQDR